MNPQKEKSDRQPPKRRLAHHLSDEAPPVIIYIGNRKAFKDPVWLIRTLTQRTRRLSHLKGLVPVTEAVG
jgi:hypothetical protein